MANETAAETIAALEQLGTATETTARQRNILYVALRNLYDNPDDATAREEAKKALDIIERMAL